MKELNVKRVLTLSLIVLLCFSMFIGLINIPTAKAEGSTPNPTPIATPEPTPVPVTTPEPSTSPLPTPIGRVINENELASTGGLAISIVFGMGMVLYNPQSFGRKKW